MRTKFLFCLTFVLFLGAGTYVHADDAVSKETAQTKSNKLLPVENVARMDAVMTEITAKRRVDGLISDPGAVKINQEAIHKSPLTRNETRTVEVPDSNDREVIKFRNTETPQKKVDQKSGQDPGDAQQQINNYLKLQETRRPTHGDNSALRPEGRSRHDRRLGQNNGSQVHFEVDQKYVPDVDQKPVQDPKEIQQQIDDYLKLQEKRRPTRDDNSAPRSRRESRHDRRLEQGNGSQINVKVERTE